MSRLPEDLERAPLVIAEDERPLEVAPAKEPTTPAEWVSRNLFSSRASGIVTVVVGVLLLYVGLRLLRWVFVSADWAVVKSHLRGYMIGRFPQAEIWRIWVAVYFLVALAGVSWGASGLRLTWSWGKAITRGLATLAALGALLYLIESTRIWLALLSLVALFAGAVAAGRTWRFVARRLVIGGWLLSFPVVILVLRGFGGVAPLEWGGLLLNALVAVVGIVLSFPLGILLALGRRSTFPAVRLLCVGIIEIVRGAPLYSWLLFGVFVLPFLLPPGLRLAEIIRVMIMFVLFSSAYVAEIVRGGLQGVHQGQYEAARALGLPTWRMMALVILPQALRNTIPAMISHFISLFKDTSLLAIVGFLDVLRIARIAPQARFSGSLRQTLLFAAFMFWVVSFSMSRWSQRLERRLGVGER
ncbi:MAG TPA: amino acid ABC transporter permease [Actinomycetota bacterium]|nr:amino acid ABC transporter permease [Actinomycetota bacterium]